MPAALEPRKVTKQLDGGWPGTTGVVRLQVPLLREPPVVPASSVKVTVPVADVGFELMSVTVTVQVDVSPMLIDAGAQTTVVEVLSSCPGVTLMAAEVPELPLRSEERRVGKEGRYRS